MSAPADEARVARIQKYKEERRKQLMAKTATLFSSNVTDRRQKKTTDRSSSEDTGKNKKSSSELSLNIFSPSVPIRTTRTSRLRAAATSNTDAGKKSNRSSSDTSLLDDMKTKASRNSKIIERDKNKISTTKKQNHEEKENIKATATTFNDIGAIRSKPKHSINRTLIDNDRSKNIVNTYKYNGRRDMHNGSVAQKNNIKLDKTVFRMSDKLANEIKADNEEDSREESPLHRDKDEIVNKTELLKINGDIPNIEINCSDLVNNSGEIVECQPLLNSLNADQEIAKNSGFLGAVCVRKVERFSELLSNLCSPYEADVLFEDILADNGFAGAAESSKSPAVAAPCRRAQAAPVMSTPKRSTPITANLEIPGTANKTRSKRSLESSHPKTENLLPPSKISAKCTPSSVNDDSSHNFANQTVSSHLKSTDKRKTIEHSHKPSLIPKRSPDKTNLLSPNKFSKCYANKLLENKKYQDTPKKVTKTNTTSKLKCDSECTRKDRKSQAQKDKESESLGEKYQNSKKRLTSLENSSKNAKDVQKTLSKDLLSDDLVPICNEASSSIDLSGLKNAETMSILHESVRPHPNTTRLSQELDSLAALTKQTLDRVNKLSNNLGSKLKLDTSEPAFDALFASTSDHNDNCEAYNYGLLNDTSQQSRGVSERLKDIDTAAQRLIDFEKQSAMFSDLSHDTSSQNRRHDNIVSSSFNHVPVSILKRKSIHEDSSFSNHSNHAIASPPVTFSPNVVEPRHSKCDRQRQGILKKRRSLDESQVARRRSCSPEVSFADDGSSDTNKPILKNRRSSLEDVVRNRSPDCQIQGILKRKFSKEEENIQEKKEDQSYGSPEPHGILKRKSNSSSSSSTTSSHVSIAQAVLLAAAGGAEIVDDEKETVRPILKKKSFSEERSCPEIVSCDTPKPILKKKSLDHDDHDLDRPKKPILKTSKRLSSDDGHASSFDYSEDDRSSRRSSLLRSRTSDHSGSECETTVKPILKQRGSSLTRERSQSPRPRLSFCADNDANVSGINFSSNATDSLAAGPSRALNIVPHCESAFVPNYPSAVLRRRDLRPRSNPRSKSLAGDFDDELLSILNTRRLKVEENCVNGNCEIWNHLNQENISGETTSKAFPSIASRIKNMEQTLTGESTSPRDQSFRSKVRDRDRYKTQPITIEEMRSITSSLEPGQMNFQAFGPVGVGSFPSRPAEFGAVSERNHSFLEKPKSNPTDTSKAPEPSTSELSESNAAVSFYDCNNKDSFGEATFLDFENSELPAVRRQSTLDEIEKAVDKVRIALDEECRALEEDDRQQGDADVWSLNVSCDSGVYNRASSRDSGPHSGEDLGLVESQEKQDTQTSNSSEWSPTNIERGLLTMDRQRKSTEVEADQEDIESDDDKDQGFGFAPGLVKSNSVVARASMWQQLQQQARGVPRPLIRHSRSKNKDGQPITDRFKTQPIVWNNDNSEHSKEDNYSLSQSKSSANVLDRDEDAKLDEDDPAKMSLVEKMKMFNSKLTHKPPVAGLPKPIDKREKGARTSRRTMPVLASHVQEAMEQNERFTKSMTQADEVPRNPDFQRKMELFRSASAKNTSLEYIMRQNSKNRSLDLEDERPWERAQRMITPEVRGILKSGATTVPNKSKTLTKGESSEGLKDEGIDSSSDEDSVSASSVTSSEKSCSSSDSSEEIPEPKPKRFQNRALKNHKLKSSRTDSDITRLHDFPRKIQLPCANELKERLNQVKKEPLEPIVLGKLRREPSRDEEDKNLWYKKSVKNEPVQLGKLRRSDKIQNDENKAPVLKISALNQEAKNRFFGLDNKKEKTIDELTAAVRKFIPPVSRSMSTHVMEAGGSGSDGESSGGREVRHINTRGRHRVGGGGIQRSATNADMPQRGSTIAERLAALQEAGANNWRTRKCRLSPDRQDMKAIEIAKNRINETLNAGVDEKKKVQIDKTELGANILADTRNKLQTASQQWRARVPQNDANLFTVAGRLERDKVTSTPPITPPPVTAVTSSPGIPAPNKFRSRKQPSSPPTNGFASGPLRSASCAVVSAANATVELKPIQKHDRESFKRSHSVSESISRLDEGEEKSTGAEKSGCAVRVPRADDETFHAFFTPVLEQQDKTEQSVDVDLDAIDSGSRQLLTSDWSRRAKRERRHAASRNPLKALAARTDIKEEYCPPPSTGVRERLTRDMVVGNCGLAAEALAALATKEDFSNVALKSAMAAAPTQGTKSLMLLQVKGRRRVQTRLVEPVHGSVNRGDCFILITPDQLIQYVGLYSNVIEKNRSSDIALHIQNTKDLGYKNSNSIITIDEQTKNYSNKHWTQFWTLLGVENIDEYKPIETGHPDEDEIYETCMVQTNMCYEVMDDELVPIKEYWGQVPKIAMLQLNKTIVFDFGSELYIWYGKNVPLDHRRRAAQLAQELFDNGYNYDECHINPLDAARHQGARDEVQATEKISKTRPEWAILSKVTQHMETILFREKFLDWPDYTRVIKVKPQDEKSSNVEIVPCDAEEMWANEYEDPDLVLEGSHIGRGTNYYDKETMRHYEIKTRSLCKWIIQEFDYQKIEDETEIGEFFSADSYILRWEYQITVSGRELNGKPSKHNVTGRNRCAYFCWQGKDASSNEKGAAALLTVELDKEKGPQVRVAQGNEPAAFLSLFQGNLIIHQGKKNIDKSRYKLFVTRGNLSNEAYLLQVPCSARQLRSRGSQILVDTVKNSLYVWHGSRSLKHTKNIAMELATKLAKKSRYLFSNDAQITEVKEGDEPKEVLDALGSNKQLNNSLLISDNESNSDVTPRLFHFTDLSGQFEANEVLSPLRHETFVTPFPFEQKELYSASQPALFLLDSGAAVWLWMGWWPRADDGELEPAETSAGVGAFAFRWQAMRVAALRTAEAYWRVSRGDARPEVRVVVAGLEPSAFTHLFDTWRESDHAAEANIAHGYKAGDIISGTGELSRLTSCTAILSLAALQRRPLPDHVDPQHLERHLNTPDFLEAFGMSKDEFSVLPAWKQTNLKKEIGLF